MSFGQFFKYSSLTGLIWFLISLAFGGVFLGLINMAINSSNAKSSIDDDQFESKEE